MQEPQATAEVLVQAFQRIQQESMQNNPILNHALQVEALGFQEYQGRVIGIVITPWFMNLFMLPGEEDNWDDLQLGDKQPHEFPANIYTFLVNEIDGVGRCLSHSLYSPMNEFDDQDHALAAAASFLDLLMVKPEHETDIIDEDLLGRIMRGEETPEINLDEFAEVEQLGDTGSAVSETCPDRSKVKREISRRDLLRGNFLEER